MKMRKGKKIILWFFIGVILAIATLFTAIVVFVYFFMLGGPAKVSRDISTYEQIFDEYDINTAYITFPEHIPEGTKEVEYCHSYRNLLFSPEVETFLQCTYDEQTYEEEIKRLENTSKTYGNKKMELLRDTTQNYYYPAYIAVENAASTYEYALITGERQITYIFTMYKDSGSVHFDKKYLPKDYDIRADEEPVFGEGYSIYYESVTPGLITTDYSREAICELTGTHMKMLGNNSFYVYYSVDEKGKEIITKCSFWKDKAGFDIDEKQYHTLDGKEYKDMEVSEDGSIIRVTYLEDNVEKVQEFDVSSLQ